MKASLATILDRQILRRMAGARSFGRGEEYFASGRVGALAEHEGQLTVKVRGTREYLVKLWADGDHVGYSWQSGTS